MNISFLDDPAAEKIFSRLDYMLREGVHIQTNEEQQAYFNFIAANEAGLRDYYAQFFRLYLTRGGELRTRYYYLEFNNGERGPVDERHRYFLKPEHTLIGLLLHKLLFLDGHFDLHSVREFQRLLRTEYEELRPSLNRLLGKGRNVNTSQATDEQLNEAVDDAMREFKKLGWLHFVDEDTFELQASFDRLTRLYADSINQLNSSPKNQQP